MSHTVYINNKKKTATAKKQCFLADETLHAIVAVLYIFLFNSFFFMYLFIFRKR